MTIYSRTDRYYWRSHLRRLAWRITLALSALALLLVLLPTAASAGTCPAGYPISIPHGCRSVTGNGVACNSSYQGTFRQVNGRWMGRCVPGPVVWGGQP
jgi:hypothetical protein